MTKTTRKVRREAVLICALSASNYKGQHITARWIGAGKRAQKLAAEAYNHAVWAIRWAGPRHSWAEINGEAEAMLRRGWPMRDGFSLDE